MTVAVRALGCHLLDILPPSGLAVWIIWPCHRRRAGTVVLCAGDPNAGRGQNPGLRAGHRSWQAGDRFRCGREGRIAGGGEPSPAGLNELDLVRR